MAQMVFQPTTKKKADFSGGITSTNFDKLLFNKLVDNGMLLTTKQLKAIKTAVFESLIETTNIGTTIETVSNTSFIYKKVRTRIYGDLLNKENGVETLLLVHPEVMYNRKNVIDESLYKFKGKRDPKNPDVFITTDGKKISISKEEQKIEELYFSGNEKRVVLGSDEPIDMSKIFINGFAKYSAANNAVDDNDDEDDVEEVTEEKVEPAVKTSSKKKTTPAAKKIVIKKSDLDEAEDDSNDNELPDSDDKFEEDFSETNSEDDDDEVGSSLSDLMEMDEED